MPVQVQGPDGNTYQFPDGTDKNAAIAYFKKKGIGVKAPPKGDWRDPLTRIDPHQPVHSAKDVGREVVRGVGNIGAGGLGVLLRPVSTAEGVVSSIRHPIDTATEMAKQLKTQPLETIESGIGQAGATAGLGETFGGVAKGVGKILPKETIRTGVQSVVGAGAKPVAEEVSKAAEQSVKERTAVAKSNREAQQVHAQGKAETAAANKEKLRKQGKIEPTQQKLKTSSEELRARIETAREKALKVGDEKYNTIRESLNPLSADMEKIHGLYHAAHESFGELQAEPPLVKRLGKELEHGEELKYKDLQSLYSELGKELSKGTLLGSTFHALDLLQEGIGEDMQRIADSKGQGAQLTDARNYWRRMKQTFGKQYHPTDAATATAKALNPVFASSEAQANQLRLLSAPDMGDPEIAKVAQGITNAQQGVDALGPKKPLRDILKPNPAPAETKPLPTTEVNTREIREKALDRWAKGESQFGRYQIARLASGGIGGIVGLALDHGVGAGIGGTVGATFGPAVLAKMVEMPAVREWLTRPPVEELEALQRLPNADRIVITDGLKQVVETAQKQGKPIPVSAKIAVLLGLAPQKKRVAAALTPQ